jgi:hypothetical protein
MVHRCAIGDSNDGGVWMPLLRKLPPGALPLFLGAVILGIDAIFMEIGGHRMLANWGFVGAAVAIAIAVAFGHWSQPKTPRPR